jgi:hypothetical protein
MEFFFEILVATDGAFVSIRTPFPRKGREGLKLD